LKKKSNKLKAKKGIFKKLTRINKFIMGQLRLTGLFTLRRLTAARGSAGLGRSAYGLALAPCSTHSLGRGQC